MKLPLIQIVHLVIVSILLIGCAETPKPELKTEIVYDDPIPAKSANDVKLYPTEFVYLEQWQQDNHAKAFASFQNSCAYWKKLPKSKKMQGVFDLGTVGDWVSLCDIHVPSGGEKEFFERWFKPHAISKGDTFKGLFTGYFVPQLRGSYTKTERYNIPIYKVPNDLVKSGKTIGRKKWGKIVPYYTRAEIYAGALANKGLELLWVDDLLDAYFMEVQGSGRVLMEDGTLQGVSYAGKNGQPYFAIGKALVDSGAVSKEDISMQTIRAWIIKHPDEGLELMKRNRSYVFFRLTSIKAGEGAIGAMTFPLTAKRSLAIDRKHLPLGVPLWLDVEHPTQNNQRIQQLMMAQDTGGAIKGPIRGDFYWGEGKQAGELAGVMKSAGRYFLLIPRSLYR